MCGSFLHAFYVPPLRVKDPTQKQLVQIQGLLSLRFRCKTFVTCSTAQTLPRSGRFGATRILRKSHVGTHNIYTWERSFIQTATPWNLTGRSRTAHRLRYRPTVFFRHLRLIPLSFQPGKIQSTFKNVTLSFFTFIKLRKAAISNPEMQLSREMSTLSRNCYFTGQKLYRSTDPHPDPQIYTSWQTECRHIPQRGWPGTVTPVCLSNTQVCLPNTPAWHYHTGVSTRHTGLALSHRCVYPTHGWVYPTHPPGTVTPVCLSNTPVCLPNTPAWHCHTGVYPIHRCVYPTHRPGSHTGVSIQHTGLALSHRCLYPTHRPGTVTPVSLPNTPTSQQKQQTPLYNYYMFHQPDRIIIRLTTKGKHEQLHIITTPVSRSGRNMCHVHKNKICLDHRSSAMLRIGEQQSVTAVLGQPAGPIFMGQAASVPEGR